MTERVDCASCRAKDVDREHVDRCTARVNARAEAVKHGRGDIGIHGERTSKLWHRAHDLTGDPWLAAEITKAVIDLGWRPVLGYDAWEVGP